MRDAASKVQIAFDKKKLGDLADLCEYPLTVLYGDGHVADIENKEAFLALGEDVIFSQKMREAIGATNTAKLTYTEKAGALMGGDHGLTLRKRNGKWRVNHFMVDSYYASASGTSASAAEDIQKTFYYQDLDTLSQMCDYPLDFYFANGDYQAVQSAADLRKLGEERVFPQALMDAVQQADPNNLAPLGSTGLRMGGDHGLELEKMASGWKIRAIIQ